jgi:hypothetical protein
MLMTKQPDLQAVVSELRAVGIEPHIEQGGSHIKVSWKHKDEPRLIVVAKTLSDSRGALNTRARVRRQLRKDGVGATPPSPINKPSKDLQPLYERIRNLEGQLAAFTDLFLDVAPTLSAMLTQQNPPGPGFVLRVELTPEQVGPALGSIYALGLHPRVTKLLPKKEEPPKPSPLANRKGYKELREALRHSEKVNMTVLGSKVGCSGSQLSALLHTMAALGEVEVLDPSKKGHTGRYKLK